MAEIERKLAEVRAARREMQARHLPIDAICFGIWEDALKFALKAIQAERS